MACNFLGNKINGTDGRYIICSPSPANGCNSKKKIKLTVNSTAQKKDCKFWKNGLNMCHIFEAEMWANRPKTMQVFVNLVNKWFWHVSRWIYIQRQASIFNLSSSSFSAAGTTSRLLLLAALLSTLRYEALLHRWPGHSSTPPHLLFFSTDCRTTPYQNQLTLVHLSVCDFTPASSHLRLVAVRGLAVVHHLGCARRGVANMVNKQEFEEDYTWIGW